MIKSPQQWDQAFTAMTHIDGAMREIVDGTEQVNHSARRPAEVGGELRRLVERYKV